MEIQNPDSFARMQKEQLRSGDGGSKAWGRGRGEGVEAYQAAVQLPDNALHGPQSPLRLKIALVCVRRVWLPFIRFPVQTQTGTRTDWGKRGGVWLLGLDRSLSGQDIA